MCESGFMEEKTSIWCNYRLQFRWSTTWMINQSVADNQAKKNLCC